MVKQTAVEGLLLVAGSHIVARCLHVVADLGVADLLDGDSRSVEELADATGTHPESLGRMLRLLSAHGVFEYHDGRCEHSATSRVLRVDHPESIAAFVRMMGSPRNWSIYGQMEHTARTGRSAVELVAPEGYWPYINESEAEVAVFSEAMQAKAHGQVTGIMAAYDFSVFNSVVDVGGARGHLLQAILKAAPKARGVLFDLPHVVRDVAHFANERFAIQGGDFFVDPLPCCDAYLLMEVIHDWDDEKALEILKAVRRVAPPHAKLLLMEAMVSESRDPSWSKMLDIGVMVLFAGKQRTEAEYQALLTAAGFRLQRQIDVPGSVSILEAVVALS